MKTGSFARQRQHVHERTDLLLYLSTDFISPYFLNLKADSDLKFDVDRLKFSIIDIRVLRQETTKLELIQHTKAITSLLAGCSAQ